MYLEPGLSHLSQVLSLSSTTPEEQTTLVEMITRGEKTTSLPVIQTEGL